MKCVKILGVGKVIILMDTINNLIRRYINRLLFPLVAQLDNAADSDSEERGFESLRAGQKSRLALQGGFLVIFAFRRVILLRSDICLATSDIRFASFNGEYNITETERLQYYYFVEIISLFQKENPVDYCRQDFRYTKKYYQQNR